MLLTTLRRMLRTIGIRVYRSGDFWWGCQANRHGTYTHHFLGSGRVIPLSVRYWNLFQEFKGEM